MTLAHDNMAAASRWQSRSGTAAKRRSGQTASAFWLLLAVTVGVADVENAENVNERPPMTRAELERHWQVNCAATRVNALAAADAAADGCAHHATAQAQLSVEVTLRDLQLCAVIHNAPGSADSAACPDYRVARQALLNLAASPCDAAHHELESLRRSLQCAPTESPAR